MGKAEHDDTMNWIVMIIVAIILEMIALHHLTMISDKTKGLACNKWVKELLGVIIIVIMTGVVLYGFLSLHGQVFAPKHTPVIKSTTLKSLIASSTPNLRTNGTLDGHESLG